VKTKNLILFAIFLFLTTSLYTLYPNPVLLATTVYRIFNPPIDPAPEEIALWSRIAEIKGTDVEDLVKLLIRYQYDWETYNIPWYFPTVEEAMEKRKGDCKTRMLITASILHYQEEPYSIVASPTHVWVDYPGKKETTNENKDVSFFSSSNERGTKIKRPHIDWGSPPRSFWKAFWDPMPKKKKESLLLNLFSSVTFVFCFGCLEKSFLQERGRSLKTRPFYF